MTGRRLLLVLWIVVAIAVQPLAAADPQATYQKGVSYLYNLDFPQAEEAFRSLIKDHPGNPDYWNVLGTAYWLKILYSQQKLNMESFSGKDRFGTADSKDSGYEAEEKQLRETVDKAMELADAMLKKNPKDVQALYAKGVSYATLASFEATIRRSWLSAARKAKAARDQHRKVLSLDPSFDDARTSVGIYNYAVGSLSAGARFLVAIVGLGGDGKEAGLKDLETAAKKGTRAAVDAKMLLVVVYGREKQYDKALSLIDELRLKYPRNFMLEMSRASLHERQGRWDLAEQTYRQIGDKVAAHTDGYERLRLERVRYAMANSQFQAQKFGDAFATFGLVVGGAGATPNEKANAHLWMGRMADTGKNRPEALRHYEAIAVLDCDPSIKSDARDHIKKPFGRP